MLLKLKLHKSILQCFGGKVKLGNDIQNDINLKWASREAILFCGMKLSL